MALILLLMSTLLCAVTVYGACVVNEGSAPCPPPFPDFAAIFRETLNLIPELRLSIQNATPADGSGACSPMAVNWSEFNSRLNDGNPVPPNLVCRQPTTTAPIYGGSSTTSPGQFISPEVVTPGAVQSTESRDRIIAIAVGVGGGVVVIAAVILIIFAAIKCSRRKSERLLRTTSTISQAALVTDESYQPTTPDTPFAQGAFGEFDDSHSLRKGVIKLSDCTFQDSSTDATLPRATHVTPERRGVTATTEKEIECLEEAKKTVGCVNRAASAEDEEQDDAGYAGSEIGQELWENEMNALFEGAKMEENEDEEEAAEKGAQLPVRNRRQHEEKRVSGSVRCDETAPQIRDESPICTKLELNLNSSSTSEPSAYQSIELTPTKLPGSPFSTPSSARPLVSPRHFGSRHPLSQAPASDENSTKVAAKAKVRFELDSNETPPPAYSSPPPLTLAGAGELFNGDRHNEMPIDVPNELPSYTEAVSALGDRESGGWRPVAAKRTQPKPQPMPKKSASSVDSPSKSPETVGSPWGRRTDAADAVVARPRVPPPTAKKNGVEAAAAATAVVPRPRVPPPTAKKNGVDDESARQDRIDSNVEGDDDAATGHSSRPVRSLLSQFEAIAKQ